MIRPFRVAVLIVFIVVAALPALVSAQDENSLGMLSDSFEDISHSVTRSVVSIFTTGYRPSASGLLSKQRGLGSGVILDPAGYIITNGHVVEGARRVQVMIPFTEEEMAARSSILKEPGRLVGGQVIGIDRETDLAVIKVQERDLTALELGNSDDIRQGQIVLAFGSPFGLENSVSMGVVSAVARQLAPEHPVVYIQTDATINPGNSGGPLVNSRGVLVGINTMILSLSGGSEGIGFAIPSNIVKNVFQQIRSTGRVRRGVIGVKAQTITPLLARGLGISNEPGVVLGDVEPGGPADKAGLKVGDVIQSVEGKRMENGRQFDVNLYRQMVGKPVRVDYTRDGKSATVQVTVAERPDDPGRFSDLVQPENNMIPRLGVLAIDLSPLIVALLPNLRSQEGVVIAARSDDGPAWRDKFHPGDVIYSINGARIRNIGDLRSIIDGIRPGDAVVTHIQRGRRLQYLAFEME